MKRHFSAVVATLILPLAVAQADGDLVAHWKLISDAKDAGGNYHAINHGVEFKDNTAVFNGIDAWLEVAPSERLKFGSNDFSIAVWIHTDEHLNDVLRDVISWYDPDARTGFNLTLMNYAGGWRHLAAVKSGGRLKLYVDGKQVATSAKFDSKRFELDSSDPLRIGFGQHDYFNGKMKDLRLYDRALSASEVAAHTRQQ
jgi:hypothetical protein